jgi:hypothetical protein
MSLLQCTVAWNGIELGLFLTVDDCTGSVLSVESDMALPAVLPESWRDDIDACIDRHMSNLRAVYDDTRVDFWYADDEATADDEKGGYDG